ncbi:polysaccharide chain length determinant protein, PEP-CTERM locus subfamily [Thioalkalivibrio sp. K90mix]|uniref:XrtA system polysaccharide chain length determinant n=1 Tax=unclassified Thioalkalivibrio TaxID=2621013 RepID=UPI0001959F84|nr:MULTISPECIES: XrtA system polysaccharide chain length determinant [unclassified Thioalkalivibrio]ADC72996.1 polysaccharide chain length determinant protein, PEP-CTERM locus subfamily [Thioalkalivibrio sp. K90mix]
MEKIVQDFVQRARATWRRRWWILPIAWIVCLGGWAYIQSLPDTYQANAQVFVNTQSVLNPLLRGMTVRPDTEERLRMVTRTLLSRDNLETIAQQSDLDVYMGSADLDAQVNLLRGRLTLDGERRENIFTVRFRHSNPDVAERVVRETVNLFMERGLGDSRLDLSTSQRFIERQLETYERQLQAREAEIEDFKRQNARFISGDGNFYSRLERGREQVAQAELQLREAHSRLAALQRRAEESRSGGGTVRAQYRNPELDRRINDLQENIDAMRHRYTDDHPDIVAARRILSELEERRSREAADYARNPAVVPIGGTGGGDSLQAAITEAESEIAMLETRIEEFQARVARLEQDVDRAPAVESELTALTRNYDVLRDSYRQLQSRREQAIMSGAVESETDSVDFRVLEPPRRPTAPSAPDRPLMATGILLVGLGAGTGFAFLLSQLRRTINSRRQLAEIAGRPVLGTLSAVRTPQIRRRRRLELSAFSIALATLLLVYAVVMGLYLTGSAGVLDELLSLLR